MTAEIRKIIDITRRYDAKRVEEEAAFRELMSRLEEFYGQHELGLPVCRPQHGQVVAAPLHGFWCRAAMVRMRGDRTRLTSVDEANSACLPLTALRLLEPRFAQLPRQAFRCRLEDMEQSGWWLLRRLEARRLTAEFRGGDWSVLPRARLADAEAGGDDRHGSLCRRLSCGDSLNDYRPRLPPEGVTSLVIVTHASRGGDVFVRMRGDCMPSLQAALSEAVANAPASGLQQATPLHLLRDPSRVFLAPDSTVAAGPWHRAAVAKYTPYSAQVVVRLIDYGTKKLLPVNELIVVDSADDLINKLPPQAMRVRLCGVRTPLTQREASLLRRLTSRHAVALQVAGASRCRRLVALYARRGLFDTTLCSLNLMLRSAQQANSRWSPDTPMHCYD